MIKKSLLICVIHFSCLVCSGQQLPRRPFLGTGLQMLNTELRNRLNFNLENVGVVIQSVLPGSIAGTIGLKPNDILISVNGQKVASPSEIIQILKNLNQEKVQIEFWRNNTVNKIDAPIIRYPNEIIPSAIVEYGEVEVAGSTLRTIITRPRITGKVPVVFYLSGVGCGSVDFGRDSSNPQFKLIKQFAEAGFATFRVEKPGIGDSRGSSICEETDFFTEMRGYKEGLRRLKEMSWVDTNRIYLFGHSMGGVMAPIVAEGEPVKGIIVYGTIVKPLAEYFIESRRIQTVPFEFPPDLAENSLSAWSKCAPLYFFSKDSSDFLKAFPECSQVALALAFRSRTYWRQVANLNIASAWKSFKGKVLSLWGGQDVIANQSDHKVLAGLINQYNKGKAVYLTVPESTHELFIAQSGQTAGYNAGLYNPQAGSVSINWIKDIEKNPTTRYTNFSDKEAKLLFQEDGVENAYPRWLGITDEVVFQSNRTGKWQLYKVRKDGSNLVRLTNDSFNNNFVDVSPDGKKIAFVSDRDGNEEIYIMNVDGNGLTRLTNHPARDIHPYFSPDSKRILFNSTRGPTERFDIYQVDIDGSSLRAIYINENEKTCARYSPDMKQILFLNGDRRARNDEVVFLDTLTKKETNVSQSLAAEGWPVWSVDGKKIIYSSDMTGSFRLYTAEKNGSLREKLTSSAETHRDARASVHPTTGEVVFNRQKEGTIGIYLLLKKIR